MVTTTEILKLEMTGYFTTKTLKNFVKKIALVNIGYDTDCWLWTGGLNEKGYSQFWCNGKNQRGHRAAFKNFRGEIPADKQLDHLCQNEACVNPWHMDVVDNAENCYRKWQVINAALLTKKRGGE